MKDGGNRIENIDMDIISLIKQGEHEKVEIQDRVKRVHI